jgi:hypothetical protein
MPFTREQGRAALTYVIVTVMNQPEDGPMAKSLTAAQIDNVEDLGTLLEADIENLSFIALVGADPTPMGPGQRGILRAFIAFIRHCANEDNPIGHNWNEPFSVAPRPATLALLLPPLRMHVMPLQTSREA